MERFKEFHKRFEGSYGRFRVLAISRGVSAVSGGFNLFRKRLRDFRRIQEDSKGLSELLKKYFVVVQGRFMDRSKVVEGRFRGFY